MQRRFVFDGRRFSRRLLSAWLWVAPLQVVAGEVSPVAPPGSTAAHARSALDLSGHKRVGTASFYAQRFSGKKMADGHRMDPTRDVAASKTLPLGTTAKVTNLETGQSAVVTIQDRGPYAKGRIVDLSPATAEKVGITPANGTGKVEVAPITVPLPNGGIKTGDAVK